MFFPDTQSSSRHLSHTESPQPCLPKYRISCRRRFRRTSSRCSFLLPVRSPAPPRCFHQGIASCRGAVSPDNRPATILFLSTLLHTRRYAAASPHPSPDTVSIFIQISFFPTSLCVDGCYPFLLLLPSCPLLLHSVHISDDI